MPVGGDEPADGKDHRVTFGKASPIGFTRPTGQQILGGNVQWRQRVTIARYTQAGARVKKLVTENIKYPAVSAFPRPLYSADGTEIAVGAPNGVHARQQRRRGAEEAASARCGYPDWLLPRSLVDQEHPSAWSCTPKSSRAAVVARAGERREADHPDSGPQVRKRPWRHRCLEALLRPLPAVLGACGTVELNKQAKNGSVTRVTVPGAPDSPVVITATTSRLLVWQAAATAPAASSSGSTRPPRPRRGCSRPARVRYRLQQHGKRRLATG